jgi:hypothetical protein
MLKCRGCRYNQLSYHHMHDFMRGTSITNLGGSGEEGGFGGGYNWINFVPCHDMTAESRQACVFGQPSRRVCLFVALRTTLSRMVPIAHALPLLAGARVSPRCARVTFVPEPHFELRVSRLVIVCNPTHTRPRSPPHRERRTPNTASLCLLDVCRSETPKKYENSLNFLLPFPPKKTDFETETQKFS